MLQEEVDLRAEETALLHGLAPVPGPVVEGLPILLVEGVQVGLTLCCGMKEIVLDQIGGQQRCATCVQCLEDHLRLVIVAQVDDHQVQPVAKDVD